MVVVTDEAVHLSAIEEGTYVIAQASALVDENKRLIEILYLVVIKANQPSRMPVFIWTEHETGYFGCCSLDPIPEHDDANRALMG